MTLRTRNVLWYNPPYSKIVSTNIAHTFLQLIDKHFSPTNKLHKLFNRHTVRVSYSCSENKKSFISRNNKTMLRRHNQKSETTNTSYTQNCNCRRTERCPTQGNCLQANVIYKADVTTTVNNETKNIHRSNLTANNFKKRYRNHC